MHLGFGRTERTPNTAPKGGAKYAEAEHYVPRGPVLANGPRPTAPIERASGGCAGPHSQTPPVIYIYIYIYIYIETLKSMKTIFSTNQTSKTRIIFIYIKTGSREGGGGKASPLTSRRQGTPSSSWLSTENLHVLHYYYYYYYYYYYIPPGMY